MHLRTTPNPNPSTASDMVRRSWVALALAVLLLLVGACRQQPEEPLVSGVQVLGFYEFEFADIGTDSMTVSVTRLDDDGATRLALADQPQTGISVEFLDSGSDTAPGGVDPGGGRNYIWGNFRVNNNSGNPITGLTFMAYASTGNSVDGTAFRLVEPTGSATGVHPGGRLFTSGERAVLGSTLSRIGFRMSVVAYDEGDTGFSGLNTALSAFPFVDTVFPYGFAVTSTVDAASGRTIASGGEGRVLLAFNAPGLERVVWRAVAVVDDRARIALPTVYNHRDEDGFDEFLELADLIGNDASVTGKVEAVVLGDMVEGDRELPTSKYECADFDFIELDDVRLAGGGDTGASLHYWVSGGSSPNTDILHRVFDGDGNCN